MTLLIEKVAVTIFMSLVAAGVKAGGTGYSSWDEAPIAVRELCRDSARAALSVILPDVVEECRQAVINQVRMAPAQQLWSAGYDTAIEDASNALLSLLAKGE